jgi:hypothetical protein
MVYAVASARLGRNDPHGRRSSSSASAFSSGTPVLGWFTVEASGAGLRLIAETTLALVLFADASAHRPPAPDARDRRPGTAPSASGSRSTILAGMGVAMLVLPGLTVVEAALLAIAVAPTDAALGQSVVSDERVPSRIRQGLNVESGLNDGLCVPLLLIALAFASAEGGADTEPIGSFSRRSASEWLAASSPGSPVPGPCGSVESEVGRRRRGRRSFRSPPPVFAYGLATALHGSG